MLRVLSICLVASLASANDYHNVGYGGYGGPALGYNYGLNGGISTFSLGGAGLLTAGGGLAYGAPIGYGAQGPLPAAIQTRRTYEIVPLALQQELPVPQVIEVEPSSQPVKVIFRSISSPVLVQQIHTPGTPGEVEQTRSEDEPHRVLHEVMRPVIQEVREIIQPYRRVVQEVRPVLEEVHTVVAKGQGRHGNGGGYALIGDVNLSGLGHGYGGYSKAAKSARAAARAARA